ncbi:MAG: hypothetical protein HN833_05125 [Elusimicrobiaceae bacterium]|jgi:4-hydroxy 2-oxovalerate aldolase|nr:hypothetical protein [Elusimicrobiaceae bacterium]MBT3954934.1 hypothetical protein [Elusimicrobiaceae bacterium]MBT4008584.1 hypothetical protein [Elusimicrobiaceae bacterium]MBT4402978.1 hypothetical protein [Elusimicrobiaceae bacterium]MBT4439750.1 hypothetical protein [Elusimicrobiaceae bacterium]
MKILDCTLRDGGYYNSWNFSKELVKDYMKNISLVDINIIELGFRSLVKEDFLGECAYTTDEYIDSLEIPKNQSIAVMINAKEILSQKEPIEQTINKLFKHKKNSRVDYVRVAINVKDATKIMEIVSVLKELGYKVCVNLMQINAVNLKKLEDIIKKLNNYGNIDILYFADSFGSLSNSDVEKITKTISKNYNYEIGFHAHNSLGQALSNSLCAIESGCSYVDGSLLGMGRGSGNVGTEYLLIELQRKNNEVKKLDSLKTLMDKHFKPLQERFKWGCNIYYYLAATKNIHPSYVQQMLTNERYSSDDVINIVNILANETKKTNYNLESLEYAISKKYVEERGSWDIKNKFKNKEVLLLVSSPKVVKNIDKITSFIKKKNPIVIMLNYSEVIPQEYVDYYIACHPTRLNTISLRKEKIKKPVILPLQAVNKNLFRGLEILDYGLKTSETIFKNLDTGCIIPSSLVAPYAINMAISGNARRILLAGFDGYLKKDQRYYEMKNILENIKKTSKPKMVAITPTQYPVSYEAKIL